MWLTMGMVLFVLWLLAVGFFHVTGNSVHLLVVLALFSVGAHALRRGKRAGRRPA